MVVAENWHTSLISHLHVTVEPIYLLKYLLPTSIPQISIVEIWLKKLSLLIKYCFPLSTISNFKFAINDWTNLPTSIPQIDERILMWFSFEKVVVKSFLESMQIW